MKPIWKTREDLIEEGSLCIVVCFNLSRLQDTIEAVLRDTPHGNFLYEIYYVYHYHIKKQHQIYFHIIE